MVYSVVPFLNDWVKPPVTVSLSVVAMPRPVRRPSSFHRKAMSPPGPMMLTPYAVLWVITVHAVSFWNS